MSQVFASILGTIGQTPIIRLNRLTKETAGQIYVKLEYFNPSGSLKDRIALSMIEQAEKDGRLISGTMIVEPTSGNTGIALAMVGAIKGYPVTLVMPETMSVERRKLMQGYGARLILTPGHEGMAGAVARASKLSEENGWFMPAQFDNPVNLEAHQKTTAKEIVDVFGINGLDAFVAGVGTGGTITGVGEVLRHMYKTIKIYAVEPAASPTLNGGEHSPHKIQGIGTEIVSHVLNTEIYDEVIDVTDEEAVDAARKLARKEGILTGISSGAALSAAMKIAEKMTAEQKILALLPDSGERYLTTDLFKFD